MRACVYMSVRPQEFGNYQRQFYGPLKWSTNYLTDHPFVEVIEISFKKKNSITASTTKVNVS